METSVLTIDNVHSMRLSPDDRYLAISAEKPWPHLFVFDLRREVLARVTSTASETRLFEVFPVWTPDGRRLTFSKPPRDSYFQPHWVPADGSAAPEALPASANDTFPFDWTPDAKTLLVVGATAAQGRNIGTLSPGSSDSKLLLSSDANEDEPALSPSGKWLAYTSDESGRREVYVQPFPELEAKWKISADGGFSPRWSHDGRELFYRDGESLMLVAIETRDGFSAARPVPLFKDTVPKWMDGGYDVSADGQRFLTLEIQEDGAKTIVFVPNWFAELERLVPTGK